MDYSLIHYQQNEIEEDDIVYFRSFCLETRHLAFPAAAPAAAGAGAAPRSSKSNRDEMILSKLSQAKSLSSSCLNWDQSLVTLLKTGFTPTLKHYNHFLSFLSQNHKFELIIHLFSQLNSNRIKPDCVTQSIFTESLIKEHKYEAAAQFLQTHMEAAPIYRQHRVWDSIILGLCTRANNPESAFSILRDCLKIDGILPSPFTFCSLIRSFSSHGKMGSVIQVLEMIADEKINYPFDNSVLNSVIYGLLQIGKPELAVVFFENAANPAVLKFLNQMSGSPLGFAFLTTVLHRLAKCGRVVDAYKLVMGANYKLPLMNVIDYSIIVDGLCKIGKIGKALELCALAKIKGVTLDIIIYNSVIHGLCLQGCFVEAFRLFDSLEKIHVIPSEITYAILIDALSKEGYLHDASKLFDKMVFKGLKPDIRVYNSLINGYCKLGQLQEGLKLLENLEGRGLVANDFTVSVVIDGCCQNGDMERALEYFFHLKRKGVLPDILGFACLIRGLCSKGRMEESRSILREMLQNESILNLLNRIDTGVETQSMEHFLVLLCDQGSIQEAITILDEVIATFCSVGKRFVVHSRVEESKEQHEGDLAVESCNTEKSENMVDDYDTLLKSSYSIDFDSYYYLIASLCSKGELQKANQLAKLIYGSKGG